IAGLAMLVAGGTATVYAAGGPGTQINDGQSLIAAFKCLADGNATCESFARAAAAAAKHNWQIAALIAGVGALWIGTAIRIATELRAMRVPPTRQR
ncbi:MAG TPA: hypothetical protein PK264_00195, partial [Hyphomicrobiaceae bacterium]|nr:hypothetical protein [Hyphomicrobiaceae bacterium]